MKRIVYLASRYEDRPRMLEWAAALTAAGHTVTSRWINGGHEITKDAKSEDERRRFAEEDLADLIEADVFLCHSHPSFFGTGRGGRHVEFGVAVRAWKRILLVGQRENVFHWLGEVEQFDTFEEALAAL